MWSDDKFDSIWKMGVHWMDIWPRSKLKKKLH